MTVFVSECDVMVVSIAKLADDQLIMYWEEGARKNWWVGISGATKEYQEKSGHPLSKPRNEAVWHVPVLHTVNNILEM